MQILLASAKIMKEDVDRMLPQPPSVPLFDKQAQGLLCDLSRLSVTEIQDLFMCSQAIASQNKERYAVSQTPDKKIFPAVLTYYGQAYKHLLASTLTDEDLQWADSHLWISSFLYGLLRPLDGIVPYRLEANAVLPSAGNQNLFAFWKPLLTDVLIQKVKADDGTLVHLSTEEYQHLFDWKKVCRELNVVQPLFYVRVKGKLKMQAVWAKTCRGAMTRYIIRNRINDIESLKKFSYGGFNFESEDPEAKTLIFVKES